MFMPLSKLNYFIVPTLELINPPVWESGGGAGSTTGQKEEEEEGVCPGR